MPFLLSLLQPGTLYAKELVSGDPYWVCDTSVKTVTIVAGQTASVSFANTQYGALEIRKSTNTGNHLDGWKFIVKKDGAEIPGSPFTTDETGMIRISNLAPGKYLVLESPTEDPYCSGELGYHTVTVEYGKTAVDRWLNKEQGLGYFTKSTKPDTVMVPSLPVVKGEPEIGLAQAESVYRPIFHPPKFWPVFVVFVIFTEPEDSLL